MNKIKMIVTDVDGTLFDSQKQISQLTYETIKKARKQGYIFAIATGRATDSFKRVIDKTLLKDEIDYIIGYNGAMIYDYSSNTTTQYYELQPDVLKDIAKFCIDIEINPVYYDYNNVLKVQNKNDYTSYIGKNYYLDIVQADIVNDIDRPLPKILGYVKNGDMERVERLVKEKNDKRFKGFKSSNTIFEFVHPECSKDKGIAIIAKKHGFTLDNVIAFGDTSNDLEMLSACFGVCMANGSEDAKNAAKVINSYTNDESGVARFLLEEVLIND